MTDPPNSQAKHANMCINNMGCITSSEELVLVFLNVLLNQIQVACDIQYMSTG